MKKKVLISTGGSGGHVVPGTIIYEHLKDNFDVYICSDQRGVQFLNKEKYDIEIINNDDYIEFTIKDNGKGFKNLENIKKILNPYFTTKKKGTGLGLAIVNKIINDHNGSIKFSNLNDGAKVTVEFLKV